MGSETLQLRDIHLPDPVFWWPPAPGWWALLGLLIALFALVFFVLKIKKQRRVRSVALRELEKLSSEFSDRQDGLWLAKKLSILLRRICLSYFPRADVAGLTGEKWLRFLDEGLAHKKWPDRFSKGIGRTLISAPYQSEVEVDGEALLSLCSDWVHTLPSLKAGGRR